MTSDLSPEQLRSLGLIRKRGSGEDGTSGSPIGIQQSRQAHEGMQDGEWPEPVSLEDPDLPKMPPGLFPHWLDDMIEAVAIATETPRELVGMIALGVLATCNQGKFVVEVKAGYTEPLNLWVCSALDSGNRKTAVLSAMTRPLLEWEKRQIEKMGPEIERAHSERATMEARISNLRSKAAKSNSEDFENVKREIANLEAGLPEVRTPPRVWAQDVTPEKLGVLMAENHERMAIICDEGGIFDTLAGRYSNGIPNLDLFLKSHSGSPVRVDRGSRPAVMMQQPALALVLSPQPEVLKGLADRREHRNGEPAGKRQFRGRGLLARVLYCLPPSPLGHRSGDTEPVQENISRAYREGIGALLDISTDGENGCDSGSCVLRFSKGAYDIFLKFFLSVESEMRPGGRFEHIKDWAGKLPGAVARMTGNLHCSEHVWGQPSQVEIGIETMERALRLAEVLSAHALAVFDLMGADPAVDAALKVWRWVKREARTSFTARECFQALKGSFPRMEALEPALAVLTERFYVVEIGDQRDGPGRPTREFRVNPRALKTSIPRSIGGG